MKRSTGTPLRTHEIREVAVAAEVDPRTVRKALTGETVLPMAHKRIARALEERGWAHLLVSGQ